MTGRLRAAVVLGVGAGLAIAAQLAAPAGAPLYDGVVVQEPYRYLQPGSGQAGSPTSVRVEPSIENGTNAAFVAATQEYPPQAQLIAAAGAFVLGAGQTSLRVSIEPVAPSRPPSGGRIAGNVYRISAVDDTGAAVRIASDHAPTISLRAPEDAVTVSLARLADDGWQERPTGHGGLFGLFSTEATSLGDFALVTPDAGLGLLPVAVAALAAAAVAIAAVILVVRRRTRQAAVAPSAGRRTAVPSRKRPPGGRRRGRRS